MNNNWKEIRDEINDKIEMTFKDFVDEYLTLRKDNARMNALLADKLTLAVGQEEGELVAVRFDRLCELLRSYKSCRECPVSFQFGDCKNRDNCTKALVHFLCEDWDGCRKEVEKE